MHVQIVALRHQICLELNPGASVQELPQCTFTVPLRTCSWLTEFLDMQPLTITLKGCFIVALVHQVGDERSAFRPCRRLSLLPLLTGPVDVFLGPVKPFKMLSRIQGRFSARNSCIF